MNTETSIDPSPEFSESVRLGDAKLIRKVTGEGPQTTLFDLAADPVEQQPVDRPVTEGLLLSILKRVALTGGRDSSRQLILDPEMTDRLRALGYIQD